MTKIRVLSDLHLEGTNLEIEPAGEDIVVLAGDIHVGLAGLSWAVKTFDVPIVYVPGNHEYYDTRRSGQSMLELTQAMKYAADSNGQLFVLEKNEVILDGIQFIGTTLWTDYHLYGHTHYVMDCATRGMADHRVINVVKSRLFEPYHAHNFHLESRKWLQEIFELPSLGRKRVVVTHHGCSSLSVHPRWVGHVLTPAFVSDMVEEIAEWKPELWIHGHVHDNFDYHLGNTRVVVNPRGYFPNGVPENPSFDPNLIVEI